MVEMEIVLCMTGASGAGYGITILEYLQGRENITVHLVVSDVGKSIIKFKMMSSMDDPPMIAAKTPLLNWIYWLKYVNEK